VVTMHERRRFVPKVDFVTSPGFLSGGDSRRDAGLVFGTVSRIVTHLGTLAFDPQSRRLQLESLHPGVTVQQVRDNTGFELPAPEHVPVTEPPSAEELETLRSIDPERNFLG
ncbi:MAG: 3-oxoadipate--succinyl-CoA transferase subunit B, partial [Deltaproteobacteria bacterium]|nr:3-oxoadipate--succinyl-CoA transferase subunit B [Deltaproteobacteria bacterium]